VAEVLAQGLSVRGLACARNGRVIFRALSFDAAPRDVVQVHGANGSGKSSLLRLLCGLLSPSQGEVNWHGQRVDSSAAAWAGEVSYMGHAGGMSGELSVAENLRFAARLAGRSEVPTRSQEVLQRLGLLALQDVPVRRLSQGQQRRLALARVLLAGRTLWLLDEPCAGLDAQGEQVVSECIAEHARAGGIAIVTTHHDLGEDTPCAHSLDMDQLANAGNLDPDHQP